MNTANPLQHWLSAKLGAAGERELARYQLQRLRETVIWARGHSPFYRRHLTGFDAARLDTMNAVGELPFTCAADLRRNDPPLLCLSQSEICRVVTLETSGTSGPPKRLYFTRDDQESTIDFFHHGMAVLAHPGDTVLILFPCRRPGGIGDLLASALRRLGARPIAAGPVADAAQTLALIAREQVDVIAGIPRQLRALARHGAVHGTSPVGVRAVLLSADQAAPALVEDLRHTWRCEVFEHYGMTEMGLGGGVDCRAHAGYHLREADLLFEVVDPDTGQRLADGQYGEVVFSTLNRRGMPLIRYRSGDISRFIPGPCECGSALRRLERVRDRLGASPRLSLSVLDDALFALDEVVDFDATLHDGSPPRLELAVQLSDAAAGLDRVRAALIAIPAFDDARGNGGFCLELTATAVATAPTPAKRRMRIA
ncbi:DVU_1553 family AMP-dependent CoA ligase [Paludibacterium yongneupense]|uniref:DVU_1553 family AMP-dependent CoA ligase n=1 Tax=Paludibacterium yongneupense TaxID=400061 RepID=UPI0003F9C4BF|nr:AMP-binding protein [Paludibacterium yongneupense]